MLLAAIISFLAIPKDSEVPADALALAHVHMREQAPDPCTPPFVQEMHTEGGSLGGGVVRQIACFGRAGAIALEEIPADGDLGRVVLIHARQAAIARTCKRGKNPVERRRGGYVIDPRNVTLFQNERRKVSHL